MDSWMIRWKTASHQEYLQWIHVSQKLICAESSYWNFGIHYSSWSCLTSSLLSFLTWPVCGLSCDLFLCWPLPPLWQSLPWVSLIPYSTVFTSTYPWLSITFKKIKSKTLKMPLLKPLLSFSPFSLTTIAFKVYAFSQTHHVLIYSEVWNTLSVFLPYYPVLQPNQVWSITHYPF